MRGTTNCLLLWVAETMTLFLMPQSGFPVYRTLSSFLKTPTTSRRLPLTISSLATCLVSIVWRHPDISHPLPSAIPLAGFGFDERSQHEPHAKTTFSTGLDDRDQWNGQICCVVCGRHDPVHCHIIPRSWDERVRFTVVIISDTP